MKTLSSDTALQEALTSELEWDPKVSAAHIRVSARDGAVTLAGYVASYPEKLAAVRAVERVYGVTAVADDIEVKLASSHERDDSDIAEEIGRERRWNTLIPDSVEAEVRTGHVNLRGEVEWSYQRNEAEHAVRHLAGVRSVTNLITVRPHAKPKPADIEHRVSDAIDRMADLDARSIWVSTRNGTVGLHGHVHSLAERRIAEHAAEAAPGVMKVENELVVTP